MCKLSVIVPIYNVEKYIERCARSLFQQTFTDIEYIFVNDASSDNSVQVLLHTIEEYPCIKTKVTLINQERNCGPSITRNVGLLRASGDYVIFCDSDDYVDLCMYEALYAQALRWNAEIVACGIEVEGVNGAKRSLLFGKNKLYWKDLLDDFQIIEGGIYSSMCNKLIKRDFLLKNNILFNENTTMWEDLYTTLRVRFFAKVMYVVDLPLYHYCLHQGSLIHSNIESRVDSQITVVKLIETFFIEQHCDKDYMGLISYLKFISKEPLLFIDYNLWISLFPEANKYIYKLRRYFGFKKTLKYLLLGYGRGIGCFILKSIVFIKNKR